MSDKKEVYKRVGKNDWVLAEMKDLGVGDIISIHEGGKFLGLYKTAGPPYMTSEGFWSVSVSKYKEGV